MSASGSVWAVYRRLLGLARVYRPVLFVAALSMVVEAGAAGAFAWLTKPMVDETFVQKNQQFGLWLPLVIIAIFVVRGAAGYATDLNMAKAARGIARDMRVAVMDKYLRLPGLLVAQLGRKRLGEALSEFVSHREVLRLHDQIAGNLHQLRVLCGQIVQPVGALLAHR